MCLDSTFNLKDAFKTRAQQRANARPGTKFGFGLGQVMDIGLNLSAENPSDALRDRILSNPCNVMARILHDQTKDIDALKKVLEVRQALVTRQRCDG